MQDVAGNWKHAYEEALKAFREGEVPERMAKNSGAAYQGDQKQGLFVLRYCGEDYQISYPEGRMCYASREGKVPTSVQVSLFLYLAQAVPVLEREEWKTFKDLPQGYHHWMPFVNEALNPLIKGFGDDLAAFKKAAEALEGKLIKMGDVGYYFNVLPRIALQVILWAGDEEFPAKANILFNGACIMQADTATLYMIGIDLARRLLHGAGKLEHDKIDNKELLA